MVLSGLKMNNERHCLSAAVLMPPTHPLHSLGFESSDSDHFCAPKFISIEF
jgi:hypothetical protein